MRGLTTWRLSGFNSGEDLPYALDARTCVGWSRTSFALTCDFEHLGEGLVELQDDGNVTFTVEYHRQGRRGRAVRNTTSLDVPKTRLLAAIKKGTHYDLVQCQVVPQARRLVAERLDEFGLPERELDILSRWVLLQDPLEYVLVPDGAPDRIAIRRNGQIDSGWVVATGKPREELERICDIQNEIAAAVSRLRAEAVRV